MAELRHRGYSLAKIDRELQLPQGGAAKKLKQLRKKAPALIRLVRRLQDIHYWERSLDRKIMLKNMRAKQSHAKATGSWLYGRVPSGRYLDKDRKLKLEPIESEIITTAGGRVVDGETVYSIAQSTGYDHRTLRDILKNPLNKELFPNNWERLQDMLRDVRKGGVSWGFKRFGARELVDEEEAKVVRSFAECSLKGYSPKEIATEFKLRPPTVAARLSRMREPKYQKILGADSWNRFTAADNRNRDRTSKHSMTTMTIAP